MTGRVLPRAHFDKLSVNIKFLIIMKKIFLSFFLLLFLSAIFVPFFSQASECANQTGIVRCGIDATCPCTICDFFSLLAHIYDFLVVKVTTILAVIALIVGGIFMLLSAGNPNLLSKGKSIIYAAIIGLALVFCSWLIINAVLTVIGYKDLDNWWKTNLTCT